jgi:hypothetical protein
MRYDEMIAFFGKVPDMSEAISVTIMIDIGDHTATTLTQMKLKGEWTTLRPSGVDYFLRS